MRKLHCTEIRRLAHEREGLLSASVLVFLNELFADFRVAKEAEPSVTSPRHLHGHDIGEGLAGI